MFNEKKIIEEYMKTSNSVKIPNENGKINYVKKGRKFIMKRKMIMSTVLAAVISGVVILTNIGGTGIEAMKVYASEGVANKEVEFKKGEKTEITTSFKEVKIEADAQNGNVKSVEKIKEGLGLDIISKDMKSIKVKANKGSFTANYEEKGVKVAEEKGESKNGEKVEFKTEEGKKEVSYVEKDIPVVKELNIENLNGEVKDILYNFSDEMVKLKENGKLNKDSFGKIEIEIQATYKNGKASNQKLVLTMDKDGKIFGELI